MGGKCCTDRKAPAKKENGRASVSKAARASIHGATSGFDNKKRAISIGYHSKGDDAEKFDKAFETNDLKTFVKLLPSTQPIDSFEERMHPWAEDPRTVGALAGTQIAILASVADADNGNVKHDIREAGGIEPLVDFLESGEVDRVQTAVVALSFLTADCPENALAIYKAKAMPLLMKHLSSPVAGMRAAAATTLRNICVEGDEYRKEFVTLGGVQGLVGQLATSPDPALNHADVQLEAILNLQDVLERGGEDDSLIEEYAKEAIQAGAPEKLKQLMASPDQEVAESAKELLDALDEVKA